MSFSLGYLFIFVLLVLVFYLHECLYTTGLKCPQKSEKGLDPLEMVLQLPEGHRVGAGDWGWDLGKNRSALNLWAKAPVSI